MKNGVNDREIYRIQEPRIQSRKHHEQAVFFYVIENIMHELVDLSNTISYYI